MGAATYENDNFTIKLASGYSFTYSRGKDGLFEYGISSIDYLNDEYGVLRLEKMFVDEINNDLAKWYNVWLGAPTNDIEKVVDAYNDLNAIEVAYPIGTSEISTQTHPDDPLYNFGLNGGSGYTQEQWYLYNDGDMNDDQTADGAVRADIHAPEAWEYTTGRSDVIIGFVDSGTRYNHEDLQDNIWINSSEDKNNNGIYDYPSDLGDINNDGYPGIRNVDDDGDGYVDFADPGVFQIFTNGLDDDFDFTTQDELGGLLDDSPGIVGYDDDNDGVIDDYDGAIFDDDENGFADDVAGWNTYHWSPAILDYLGHGTASSGEASGTGNNDSGISGISWHSKIMSGKIASVSYDNLRRIPEAVYYLAKNGANVINLGFERISSESALDVAIHYAKVSNIVLVGSAGNDGDDLNTYPASLTDVLSVAGTNPYDVKDNHSNYGISVNICAPYGPITSISNSSNTSYADDGAGTSFSSSIVSGVAALVISRQLDLGNTNYTNDDIREILTASADNIDNLNPSYAGKLGAGRVNAFYAVAPPAPPDNILGEYQNGHPRISWDANTEPDLVGYLVYRKDPNDQIDQLTANPIEDIEYTDTELGQGYAVEYWYWVTAVDVSEQESDASDDVLIWTGPLNKELVQNIPDGIPTEYGFTQNYPNPFNPTTTIRFGLPEAGEVKLVIYDVQGKPVRTLVNRHLPAGYQSVVWQGKDIRGNQVPSGVYLISLTARGTETREGYDGAMDFSKTQKVILMK